jgi:predicted RNA-binding protein with TRAM domain
VQISEVSNRGDGIARLQGCIIFVKDGKVADNVKIRVISVGDRFAKAELI